MAPVASPGTTGNDIIIPADRRRHALRRSVDVSKHGGNDVLTATGDDNTLYGDIFAMSGDARGGNDRLSATGDDNALFGDANAMSGDARGGNDRLSATGDGNRLFGDAYSMSGNARGGNDRLSATGDYNPLFGDASAHVRRRPRRQRQPDRHG